MSVIWVKAETLAAMCPVCDAPGPHAVTLRTGPHTLLRCAGCTGCFYLDRVRPDYGADASSPLFNHCYVELNAGVHFMSRFLWAFDDPETHSVLDAGCGFGFSVDVAAKVLGWRAVGIDPSHHARDGRRMLGADIRQEWLTDETDLGEPFDLVLAVEVIEHIPDLYPFLRLLRRWMKPGARLVLTTPDADSLSPAVDDGMLFAMLSAGGHLVLFNARSMEFMLRRAGFLHVRCEAAGGNLVAYASDAPLQFRADAGQAHNAGYQVYLQRLLDIAEPGQPLWNGAAGRKLALEAAHGPLEDVLALFSRVTEVWRQRFGIDLARHQLPPPIPEAEFARPGPALLNRLLERQPLNLGSVLYHRAVLESRMPGRLPEAVLRFARGAYSAGEQTTRALENFGLIDGDLKHATWQARIVCTNCLIELAPELEGPLLAALAAPSPGTLAGRIDPPVTRLIPRIAPFFSRHVHAGSYDEAMRFEALFSDRDTVTATLRHDPMEMFHALFCAAILRLNAMDQPALALEAFQHMADIATADLQDPARAALAGHFLAVAEEHLEIVRTRVAALRPPRVRRRRVG